MPAKKPKPEPAVDVSERMVPEFHANHSIYGEHYIRYEAANQIVKDKVVLDIASGSGYGTKMLARTAKKVYGVDISQEAVDYSQKNFAAKNISYLVGDGESIPLANNSVDVVVSFETIEHLKDYKKFIKEIKRVLKSDGLTVLSTPNELEFAEGNHYHLHEFEEKELVDLIHTEFSKVEMYYQGDWVYSALLSKELISKENEAAIRTFQLAPLDAKNYLYFYALCANREITEVLNPVAAMSEHWSARTIQEEGLKNLQKQQLTDQHIANLNAIQKDREKYIHNLEKELSIIKSSRSFKFAQKAGHIKKRITKR